MAGTLAHIYNIDHHPAGSEAPLSTNRRRVPRSTCGNSAQCHASFQRLA